MMMITTTSNNNDDDNNNSYRDTDNVARQRLKVKECHKRRQRIRHRTTG